MRDRQWHECGTTFGPYLADYGEHKGKWVMEFGGVEGGNELPITFCPYCGKRLVKPRKAKKRKARQ